VAGHWQTYLAIDGDTGKTVKKQRWVEDPAAPTAASTKSTYRPPLVQPPQTPAGLTPAQKARLEASAKEQAQKALADSAKARTNKALWDLLRKRQAQQMAILDGRPEPAKKFGTSPDVVSLISKIHQAGADRATLEAVKHRKYDPKKKSKDVSSDLSTLERLIAEARARQEAAGDVPTSVDSQYLIDLQEQYSKRADALRSDVEAADKRFIKQFGKLKGKDGKYRAETKEQVDAWNAFFADPEYRAMMAEWNRVAGTPALQGSDGSASKTQKTFDAIALAQRAYLWNQGNTAYKQNVSFLQKNKETDEARSAIVNWQTGERYMYDSVRDTIPATQTGIEIRNGFVHKRTPDEEVDFQRQKYIAKQQQQFLLSTQKQMISIAGAPIGVISQIANSAANVDSAEMQSFFDQAQKMSGVTGVNSRPDQQRIVDAAMSLWDAKYGRLFNQQTGFVSPTGGFDRENMSGMQYGAISTDPVRAKYLAAREQAYQSFYRKMGVDAPNLLEKVPGAIPPIQGLANMIGAGPGIFGTSGKVVASAIAGQPAELLMSGGTIQFRDLPSKQQEQVIETQSQLLRDKKGGWYVSRLEAYQGLGNMTADEITNRMTKDALEEAVYEVGRQFFTTPQGQAWGDANKQYPGGFGITTGRTPDEAKRIQTEAASFAQKFYEKGIWANDGRGDPMMVFEALNQYGQAVATPDSIALNLAYSMILDPTNAIPLKATTWLARLKYADSIMSQSKDMNLLSKAWKGLSSFQRVTEPELRWEKVVGEAASKLAEGVDPALIREAFLGALLKIEPDKQEEAIAKFLRESGINPNTASGRNAMTMTEEAMAAMFKRTKTEFPGFAAEQEKILAKYEADKALADFRMKAVDAHNALREKLSRDQHMTSYEKLMAEREAEHKAAIDLQKAEAAAAKEGVEVPDRTEEIAAAAKKVEEAKTAVDEAERARILVEAEDEKIAKAEAKRERKNAKARAERAAVRLKKEEEAAARVEAANVVMEKAKEVPVVHERTVEAIQDSDALARAAALHNPAPVAADGSPIVYSSFGETAVKEANLPRSAAAVIPPNPESSHTLLGRVYKVFGRHSSVEIYPVEVGRGSEEFEFALGKGTEFFATPRGKRLAADLNATHMPNAAKAGRMEQIKDVLARGWVSDPSTLAPGMAGSGGLHYLNPKEIAHLKAELANLERDMRPNAGVRDSARRAIREEASRSFARVRAEQQGAMSPLKGVEREQGWSDALGKGGVGEDGVFYGSGYEIPNGPKSTHQFIPDQATVERLGGARTPAEGIAVRNDFRALESLKWEFSTQQKRFIDGKITRKQLDDWIDKHLTPVILKRAEETLDADLHRGMGTLDVTRGYEPGDTLLEFGHVMTQDLLNPDGTLNQKAFDDYYATFTLLGSSPEQRAAGDALGSFDTTLRRSMEPRRLERYFTHLWLQGVSGPKEFRENGQALFNLFSMTLLDGDMTKLKAYGVMVRRLLKKDQQMMNPYLHMWQVMEKRAMLPWMNTPNLDFEVVEAGFMNSAILTGGLHPNMALAMIPYGPFARETPTRFGYSNLLDQIPKTKSRLFAPAPYQWNDYHALSRILEIGSGRFEDPGTSIRAATQVLDYIAERYGELSRRQMFALREHDLSIYMVRTSLGNHPEMLNEFEKIRREFAFDQVEQIKNAWFLKNPRRKTLPKGFERRAYDSALVKFEAMMGSDAYKNIRTGMSPEYDTFLRDRFFKAYWTGAVTHDNPGLHTLSLLFALQRSSVQKGQQWQEFALRYINHMDRAGYGVLGREVVGSIFESQRYANINKTMVEVLEAERARVAGEVGAVVQDFWVAAGIAPTVDQAEAHLALSKLTELAKRLEDESKLAIERGEEDDAALMDWTRANDSRGDSTAANYTEETLLQARERASAQIEVLTTQRSDLAARLTASPWASDTIRDLPGSRLAKRGEFPEAGDVPVVVVPDVLLVTRIKKINGKSVKINGKVVRERVSIPNPDLAQMKEVVDGVSRIEGGGMLVTQHASRTQIARTARAITSDGIPLAAKRRVYPDMGPALMRLNVLSDPVERRAFVEGRSEPLRSLLKQYEAERAATSHLMGILHGLVRTTHAVSGLSYEGEQAMRGIVADVLKLRDGKKLLNSLASAQGETLLASRLGQYMRDQGLYEAHALTKKQLARAARQKDAMIAALHEEGSPESLAQLDRITTAVTNRDRDEAAAAATRLTTEGQRSHAAAVAEQTEAQREVEAQIVKQTADLRVFREKTVEKIRDLRVQLKDGVDDLSLPPVPQQRSIQRNKRLQEVLNRRLTELKKQKAHDEELAIDALRRMGQTEYDARSAVTQTGLLLKHKNDAEIADIEKQLATDIVDAPVGGGAGKTSEIAFPATEGKIKAESKDLPKRPLTPEEANITRTQIDALVAEIADVTKKYDDRAAAMRDEVAPKVEVNPIQAANDAANATPAGTPERAAAEQKMVDENLKATDAKGGTRESGGAVKPASVIPPTPAEDAIAAQLNEALGGSPVPMPVIPSRMDVRVESEATMFETIAQESEEVWLRRETAKAAAAIRKTEHGSAERVALRDRLRDLARALKVIDVRKGHGTFIGTAARGSFARVSYSINEARVTASFAPKRIAPFVVSYRGVINEQGRRAHSILHRAEVDPALGAVEMTGEVSSLYKRQGKRLDALFDQPMTEAQMRTFGLPVSWAGRVTPLILITGESEFESAVHNPEFLKALDLLKQKMDHRLSLVSGYSRRKAGEVPYSLKQYMSDRLMVRGDHFDAEEYERINQLVSDAINGPGGRNERADTWTQTVHARGDVPGDPRAELLEQDLRVILAKAEVLKREGVDLHAYNEAHILRSGFVAKKASAKLLRESSTEAMAEMARLGLDSKTTAPKVWDKVWGETYKKIFLRRRAEMAKIEARKQYEELARGDAYGNTHEDILRQFEDLYGSRNIVLGQKRKISIYQRNTLERAVEHYLGVPDIRDKEAVAKALSSVEGQTPPFENRAGMREFFVENGMWTPRTSAVVDAGGTSWSITEEYDHFIAEYGRAPEWANPSLFLPGQKYYDALHFESIYSAALRKWGGYNENFDARIETGLLSRDELISALANGNEALHIHAMRDLPAMRKYVMERYGDIVKDSEGNLIAMPWLMHREELKKYVLGRTAKSLDHVLPQDPEAVDLLGGMINKSLGRYFDDVAMAGKTITNEEYWRICTDVVNDVLENPLWLRRDKDMVGDLLRKRATMVRLMVMSNPAFAASNVIDSVIKESWAAFTTRSFRTSVVSEKAAAKTPMHFGFGDQTQLISRGGVHGTQRVLQAVEGPALMADNLARTLDGVVGVYEISAEIAGVVETAAKLRLAQHMYDRVFADALRRLKDPGLADAAACKFIGAEVQRMWPTVGDGPLERFFNMIVPFASYQVKNRVMFLGELVSHPFLYNWFNQIGNAIEQHNREQWAIKHPDEWLDDVRARMIELPWAPRTFFDFGSLSDMSRGVQPLYDLQKGTKTIGQITSLWVRLVSANEQNAAMAALNMFGLGGRTAWEPIIDIVTGQPTGRYKKVILPYEAPWGGEAKLSGSFWLADLVEPLVNDLDAGGVKFTLEGFGDLMGKMLFFGGSKIQDRGAGLNLAYWAMKKANPAAADRFLKTPSGQDLLAYWADNKRETRDSLPLTNTPPPPPSTKWLDSQTEVYKQKIYQDLDALREMERRNDHRMWQQQIGSQGYEDAKAQANLERFAFYRSHPEMYEYTAMTSDLWKIQSQITQWQTDALRSRYYQIPRPEPDGFKTEAEFITAQAQYVKTQEAFLKMFPQVRADLLKSRSSLEQIWSDTEQEWFDVLDRVGTRGIAIEAARQKNDYSLSDQLYQMNQLEMNTLTNDEAVTYFDPTTDFPTLPVGAKLRSTTGSMPTLRQNLVPRLSIFPDFNKWRWDHADLEKRATMERDQKYGDGMSVVIANAKKAVADAKKADKADAFGASFVKQLKDPANLFLRDEYFRRNIGKREEWAANDAYIKEIGKYGKLIEKGHFDAAYRYFVSMTPTSQARYMKKHGLTAKKMLDNQEYGNWMGRWIDHYNHRDYAGGAAFFAKMPEWVKYRYFLNHPDSKMKNGGGSGGGTGSSPYSRAMGKWVGLLKKGDEEGAKAYFNSMPKAFRDRYYAKHPEQKLRNNVKMVGQLADYFTADDASRAEYLRANPQFAKWLKTQGTSAAYRRVMITTAYQAIPKEEAWLRRVFREKYPEVFSKEAAGQATLKSVYASLSAHPDMIPSFQKWLAAIWASYAENAKHTKAPPKPIEWDHSPQRSHGVNRKLVPHRGMSAAWVRIHTV